MMFRRFCASCGDLAACSGDAHADPVCGRCGGALTGPFVFPVPESYRERVEVLVSPHYLGAVATHETQLR